MKKTIAIGLGLLLLPAAALAATISAGQTLSVDSSKIIEDNVYMAGAMDTVAGTINGDLVSVGQSITITGLVRDDGFLLGSDINVLGKIGGDLRAAGEKILIGDSVEGDAVLAAGSVALLPKASIGGDLLIAVGEAVLDGTVNGRIIAKGGRVSINGNVSGPVNFEGEELTIGAGAVIGGDLTSAKDSRVIVKDGAVIKGAKKVTDTKPAPLAGKKSFAGLFVAAMGAIFFLKMIATLVAALVLGLLFKKTTQSFAEEGTFNFGRSLLTGLVTMIVLPITAVILVFTLAGAVLGAVVLGIFVALLLASHIFSGVFIGAFLFRHFFHSDGPIVNWKSILVGVVLYYFLWFVPFIGPLVGMIVCLASFGALTRLAYEKIWLDR